MTTLTYEAPTDLAALAPFVERLTRHYGRGLDRDEARSQVWWRVMRAAETYEPGRGKAFESWAIWHVRSGLAVLRRAAERGRRVSYNTEWVESAGQAPAEPCSDVFAAEALDAAMAKLPPRQREAVELVFYRGMPRDAAGPAMGITRQGVQNLLAKALVNLREAMGEAA